MHELFSQRYYTSHELRQAGFKSVGENVRIHENCCIHGVHNISLGNNVRVDAYVSLIATGSIEIGSFVHIGSYSLLSGGEGIRLSDFSGLSQGVKIYSRSDDYSGEALTNPMVPEQFTKVERGPVELGRHVVIGSGTVILPGVCIEEGASVGALSLVTKSLAGWHMYFGAPAKRIRPRSKQLLDVEQQLLHSEAALPAAA